ncbi:MAG TPA: histidine phosphatase family protein [Candidatus Dojkabacteria bacterium]|nr:histidine phosphatase family protein [Candidatus Dojkabacteria bacterium]HQF36057.1 histidine phosphatase family protein [Candidatus Dojkabacteria bacterium]
MKIIVLRHGESLDDVENRYGGFANYSLSEKGKSQSIEVANELSKYTINAIYSSPYLRAYETATNIAKILNLNVKIDVRIRERNTYGYLSGMNKDKAKELFPEDCENAKEQATADKIDGAELVKDVEKRVKEFIESLDHQKDETVILVMHGKVTEILLKHILKIEEKIKPKDCGFVVIDISNNTQVINKHNCE